MAISDAGVTERYSIVRASGPSACETGTEGGDNCGKFLLTTFSGNKNKLCKKNKKLA